MLVVTNDGKVVLVTRDWQSNPIALKNHQLPIGVHDLVQFRESNRMIEVSVKNDNKSHTYTRFQINYLLFVNANRTIKHTWTIFNQESS